MSYIRLIIGTTNGLWIYRSDAARMQWQVDGPLFDGWSIDSVLGDSQHGPRLFVGASHTDYSPNIRLSEDGGQRWRQLDPGIRYRKESGLTLRSVWQITPGAPSQPDTYYAGVDEAGLFVSQDRGITWQEVTGLNRHPTRASWRGSRGGLPLHTICIDPINPQRLWIAISAAGIFRSEDGGQSWRPCNRGLRPLNVGGADGYLVHKMVLDPHDRNVLYLQDFAGLYRSTDGADSWHPYEAGLPSTFGFPLCVDANGTLYAAPLDLQTRCFIDGRLRIFRRRAAEHAWQPLDNGFPIEPQNAGVLRDAMAVDSLTPTGVYFGTTQGTLFSSADEGEHWAQLPGDLARITTLRAWLTDEI